MDDATMAPLKGNLPRHGAGKQMRQVSRLLNNKAQTMKRQAYGCRDLGFFKLKRKTLHVKKYTLNG